MQPQKHSAFPQCQGKEYFCRKVLIQAHPSALLGCIAQDMTEQTSEVGHLKMRACLLLVVYLWQWTEQTLATPCDGELRIIGKDEKKCCPKCNSNTGKGMMCLSSFCLSVLFYVNQGNQVWGTGARVCVCMYVCKCILGNCICKTKW